MISRFQSDLVMRDENAVSKHGLRFVLTEPLIYFSGYLAQTITVPAGFVTDLASIPRALYIALPPIGAYDEAAVIHDYLYQRGAVAGRLVSRGDADTVLREAMEVLHVNGGKRWTIYTGVRIGGWVAWRGYRHAEDTPPAIGPAAAALLVLGALAAPAHAQDPVVAVGTFHNCPIEGDAKTARVRPLNRLKNRATVPELIETIDLAKFYEPGDDTQRFDVNQAVKVVGYVSNVKVGGIETVNCHAKDPRWRDTHIELHRSADDDALPVIVEVSPRWREAMKVLGEDWSTATLKKTLIGHTVEFVGWPLLDAEHALQATNTHPKDPKGINWRVTIWEPAHPVTSIRVLE